MPITPENLVRHELIGRTARIQHATDPGLVGLRGRVVCETTNTLGIETPAGVKTIPKATATFAFDLPDGERVTVAGRHLVGRPARRTENAGGNTWQSA